MHVIKIMGFALQCPDNTFVIEFVSAPKKRTQLQFNMNLPSNNLSWGDRQVAPSVGSLITLFLINLILQAMIVVIDADG